MPLPVEVNFLETGEEGTQGFVVSVSRLMIRSLVCFGNMNEYVVTRCRHISVGRPAAMVSSGRKRNPGQASVSVT